MERYALTLMCAYWVMVCPGCTETAHEAPAITGLNWVMISGGSFEQGNPSPAENMTDELPVRTVNIPEIGRARV